MQVNRFTAVEELVFIPMGKMQTIAARNASGHCINAWIQGQQLTPF